MVLLKHLPWFSITPKLIHFAHKCSGSSFCLISYLSPHIIFTTNTQVTWVCLALSHICAFALTGRALQYPCGKLLCILQSLSKPSPQMSPCFPILGSLHHSNSDHLMPGEFMSRLPLPLVSPPVKKNGNVYPGGSHVRKAPTLCWTGSCISLWLWAWPLAWLGLDSYSNPTTN